MSERRDDTTEEGRPSGKERAPGSYYYDDATGYEIYDPEEEEEEGEDKEHQTMKA